MTVYVDELAQWGAIVGYHGEQADHAARVGARNGHYWCHLFADAANCAALHAFARRIGLRREWFQGNHYDIVPGKRRLAVAAGAREVTRAEAVAIWRAQRDIKTMLKKQPPFKPRGAAAPLAPTCLLCGVTLDKTNASQLPDKSWKHIGCEPKVETGRWVSQTAPANPPRKLPPMKPRVLSAVTKPYQGCPSAHVLVADPPWSFDDATPHKGAEDHYETMSIDEIKAFSLPPLEDNAVLFLWRVGGGNESGSLGEAAYGVARAWGFTPKSELSWTKTLKCKVCDGNGWTPIKHASAAIREACAELRIWCDECDGRGYKIAIGMGRYVRGAHEICLICTRGKGLIPDDKSIRSVIYGERREHSAKPSYFYKTVEKLYPRGPYVELFARRYREKWHQYGRELGKLTADAEVQL